MANPVYVIAADVHGNLKRLEELQKHAAKMGCDEGFILGDMIQLGLTFDENRCIEAIRTSGFHVVRGNHEKMALKHADLRRRIFPENVQFLEGLRSEMVHDNYMFAHTLPPRKDLRIKDLETAQEAFNYLSTYPKIRAGFVGHYHEPICFYLDLKEKKCYESAEEKFCLREGRVYIINPGSLGLSKEGNFILFDSDKKTVERRKLA